ncbi:MAG TPA: amidase family protein [Gaiellaceae bacterium]|nr:amidase family protein [Gaiellaceae bacterium]
MIARISPAELHELAASWRFALTGDEERELLAVAEAVFQAYDQLQAQPSAQPEPVAAVRDPGRRPAEGEDPLNAIVRLCRVRADVADGLLSGRRVAVKDSVAVAGVPLSCGSAALQGFVPSTDSVVAERILRAGGEIVAVTNMDDLALSAGGDSSWYGPTLNPWDRGRTAGGSSSGSAAALFYDSVDVSVGGDQGGSIRVPASWCGVVGLKPTHGLVPYTGIAGMDQTFDHCGPLGRTVEAVAVLLQAIAGRDEGDPRQHGVPGEVDVRTAVERAADDLRGVRLGVVAESLSDAIGVEQATADAVRGAIERLRGLGAEPVEVSLPEHLQAGGVAFSSFVEGMTSTVESGGNGYGWSGRYWEELPAALRAGIAAHAQELSPQVKSMLVAGRFLRRRYSGALYAKAQNLRPWLRAAYDRALAGVDALLLPTTPWRAHAVDPELPVAARVLRGWQNLANTYPTDMTGHPAISLPLAEADGLPVGVMLVAPRLEDARLLSLAATCERALGWAPAREP